MMEKKFDEEKFDQSTQCPLLIKNSEVIHTSVPLFDNYPIKCPGSFKFALERRSLMSEFRNA